MSALLRLRARIQYGGDAPPQAKAKAKAQASPKAKARHRIAAAPVVELLNTVSTRSREKLDGEKGLIKTKFVDGRTSHTRSMLRHV